MKSLSQKNMQPGVCELLLRCPETLDQPMASPNSDTDPTGNSHKVGNIKLSQTYNLTSMPALLVNGNKPALITPNGSSLSTSNSSVQQTNLLLSSRSKDKDDQQKQRKSCFVKFY